MIRTAPRGPLFVLDRDGRGDDVVPEIRAVADVRGRHAPERGPDLGPPGGREVRVEIGGPVRVGQQHAVGVHHDHPLAADLLDGLEHDLVQPLGVVDVPGADRRRDPLGLDQRLVLELGRRAPLQVDRERDAERDQQDDQDVGEREDEVRADLRGRLLMSPAASGTGTRRPGSW